MSNIERCLSCGDVITDDGCACPSISMSELSREQVERECQWLVEEHCGSAAKKWLATDAAQRRTIEQRDGQIEKLAAFILAHVPGEPSKSEGAVDTAIRIIEQQAQEIARLEGVCKERRKQGQQLHDQLTAMTTERDLLQHRFDDAIEAIDRLQKEQQDVYHERG